MLVTEKKLKFVAQCNRFVYYLVLDIVLPFINWYRPAFKILCITA